MQDPVLKQNADAPLPACTLRIAAARFSVVSMAVVTVLGVLAAYLK